MNYRVLWQKNPLWANKEMGVNTDSTIGDWGCLLTCFAMLLGTDPNTLNEWLKIHGGYQQPPRGAYAATFDLNAYNPTVHFVDFNEQYKYIPVPQDVLATWVKYISPSTPVIIMVDHIPGVRGVTSHYVLAIDVSLDGKIIILDPWYGDIALLDRYGKYKYAICQFVKYAIGPVTPPPPPLPPPVTTRIQVGFNSLADHNAAVEAYNLGARFFCVMISTDTANWLVNQPGTTVLYREWWNKTLPSMEMAMSKLSVPRLDPRIIRIGINECEGIDGNDIRLHAQWDIELATRLRAQGARYAAGTFPMGTPDHTNPRINDDIRQYYAPSYNSGLINWDAHLYSPNMGHIYNDIELVWYETRYQFLFTKCGFNPDSPSHIYSTEFGLDEGGLGGFMAHRATGADVVKYCQRLHVIHLHPFVGGAIFQLGNAEAWQGYDMRPYVNDMAVADVF